MKELSVLRVLKNLRDTARSHNELGINYTLIRGFSFHAGFGICWHVFANTRDQEIKGDYLAPVFVEMGLDREYPVECQIMKNLHEATRLHGELGSMYRLDRLGGKERLDLLDNLVEYFEKKVKLLGEIELTEKDLDSM